MQESEITILRNELSTDPLQLGLAPLVFHADDDAVAAILNDKRFDGYGSLAMPVVLMWAAKHGALSKFKGAAAQVQNLQLADMAATALTLTNDLQVTLDFGNPDVLALFGAFVQAGVLTPQDHDDLLQLAAIQVSRAEQLFGRGTVVTREDIGAAR